jgi:hypothetical protein
VPGAGNEFVSRANLPLGMYIVKIVEFTRVDTVDLSKYDETPLGRKLRRTAVRIGNEYVKTRTYLDEDGAERDTSENKIVRSAYKKMMLEYWSSLNPSYRERAERMSIYVNYPVPSRALAISLKKQGANAPGARRHRAPSTTATGRLGDGKQGGN